MRIDVLMPRMGQSMETGVILNWLKQPGERVERGQPLIEIESDKATVEIEAFASGTLAEILVPAGQDVPVGTVLAVIDDGKGIYRASDVTAQMQRSPSKIEQASLASFVPFAASTPRPAARLDVSPVARRLADEQGIDLTAITGSGPNGRIIREDIEAAVRVMQSAAKPRGLDASPVARRLAHEHGIDLYTLTGSAPNGRIIKRDIDTWLEQSEQTPIATQSITTPAAVEVSNGTTRRIPLSKIKRVTASRMVASKSTVPHFYVMMDIDMGQALRLRASLKSRGHEVSINDLVLKACALVLTEYPNLNATFAGDDLLVYDSINIAIAVALGEKAHPDGLITPVIHGCEALSLSDLALQAKAVSNRARDGKLRPNDLDGATFTVSNLGMYGVKQFEAIVPPDTAAILAVGAVRREPSFDTQDRVVPRDVMTVTLSADHRVTDGAEAASFLARFKTVLEDGFALLV